MSIKLQSGQETNCKINKDEVKMHAFYRSLETMAKISGHETVHINANK